MYSTFYFKKPTNFYDFLYYLWLRRGWKDYFEVTVYDGEEIHVTIGQRDIQFDKRGNRIGSGYLFMAVEEPWEN